MTPTAPFPAKMEADQFFRMVESLKKDRTLADAYDLAEAVHQGFYHVRRYSEYKTFEVSYYRHVRNETKLGK